MRRALVDGHSKRRRRPVIVDCHVHALATTPGHGYLSSYLRKRPNVLLSRVRLGISLFGSDEKIERDFEARLAKTVNGTPELDAAVALAFDGVYADDGTPDEALTHLRVTNEYAAELARKYPKLLFGASVHPYRPDAVAELERCVAAGAVLMKWLPLVQGMNPADDRCSPFYEALAHHRLPLLCHTGGEKTLPNLDYSLADPLLLVPALKRGVTVIIAHCGTKSAPGEVDYLPQFMRLASEYENCYGDTAALCLPTRSYAFGPILKDPVVRTKILHGSDWPVISIPPAMELGVLPALGLMRERNWMRRDVLAKRRLGFDDAYWHRAAKVLRMT